MPRSRSRWDSSAGSMRGSGPPATWSPAAGGGPRARCGGRPPRGRGAGGGVGALYGVRMAGHDPAPPHEAYIPVSGGIFKDFSVHDFDALRFVTGQEVVETYADGGVIGFPGFEKYGDVDTA